MADVTLESLTRNLEKLAEALEDNESVLDSDSVADIINRLLEGGHAEAIISDFCLDSDGGI